MLPWHHMLSSGVDETIASNSKIKGCFPFVFFIFAWKARITPFYRVQRCPFRFIFLFSWYNLPGLPRFWCFFVSSSRLFRCSNAEPAAAVNTPDKSVYDLQGLWEENAQKAFHLPAHFNYCSRKKKLLQTCLNIHTACPKNLFICRSDPTLVVDANNFELELEAHWKAGMFIFQWRGRLWSEQLVVSLAKLLVLMFLLNTLWMTHKVFRFAICLEKVFCCVFERN